MNTAIADDSPSRISFGEKVAYGLGDTASNFYWQMFMNFLLFFYTDVFGISATAVGTMFLFVRAWDAVLDPVVGTIADRTTSRWGHFRPYLLWGAVPLALSGLLMFSTPDLGSSGKLVYAYATYCLTMLAYTFVNIPYSALMGVISRNSPERTTISSYRFVLAFIGLFLVQGLTLPIVRFFGHDNDRVGFRAVMVVFGALAIALFFIAFRYTRERVAPQVIHLSSLRRDLLDLFSNRPWFAICCVGIFAVACNSVRFGAVVYYFKYCVATHALTWSVPGMPSVRPLGVAALTSLFMGVGTAGTILGAAFTRSLVKIAGGKTRAFFALMMLASALGIALAYIPPTQISLLFAVYVLLSICIGPTSPLLWAFYADVADYSEWKTGQRATGLIFSAASFSQKLGFTMAGAFAGWYLGSLGFVANATASSAVQSGIRGMISWIPAIASVAAGICILAYPLNDRAVDNIEKELQSREAERADALTLST